MKQLTLTISEINSLNTIKEMLVTKQPLNQEQQTYLIDILSQLPKAEDLLSNKIPLDMPVPVNVWDSYELKVCLEQWVSLFENLPDYEGSTFCTTSYDSNEPELIKIGTVIVAFFSPTLTHAIYLTDGTAPDDEIFEVHLKNDGTAYFKLRKIENAKQHPELFNFKGSWKEAYLLTVETVKKGWPLEAFPDDLKPFLKK